MRALFAFFKSKGIYSKILLPRSSPAEKDNDDLIYLGGSVAILGNDTRGNINFCLSPESIDQVLQKENFDILHYHSPDAPFLSWQILDRAKVINIGTFHTSMEGTLFKKYFMPLITYFQNGVIKKLDGIIVVSQTARKYLPKEINVPVTVIPNGVDLSRFNPQKEPVQRFKDEKLNILFVGRFDRRKGLRYLLRAYKRLKFKFPNLRLIVVGSGPLSVWYKTYVVQQELEDVEFAGFVSKDKLPSFYATADIYCSPATHGESFGIVLLEAMATGKPVVAFANSGYRGVLVGKGADFLAPPRDIDSLAESLERLIIDEDLRREMGEWGIEEVKKYSWERVGEQVLEFYKGVMKKR